MLVFQVQSHQLASSINMPSYRLVWSASALQFNDMEISKVARCEEMPRAALRR